MNPLTLLGGMNPWLILGAVLFYLASITTAFVKGEHQQELKQAQADKIALEQQAKQKAVWEATDRLKVKKIQELEAKNEDYYRKLRGLTKQVTSGRVCFDNAAAWSVFNQSLTGDTGTVPKATTGDAKAPSGAGITDTNILDNQIENGRRWKQCRDSLNNLIDWHEGKK